MSQNSNDLSDFQTLRVKNQQADIICDILNLSAGMDFAVRNIKDSEISKDARKLICDLIRQSYTAFAARASFQILQDEGLVKPNEAVADYAYNFDLPDDDHDDLIIFYKKRA